MNKEHWYDRFKPQWEWFISSFVFRLFWVTATFAFLISVLALAIWVLDKLDIVQRSLLYFKPYASSLPWILLIAFTTILLCIPRVTKELKRLLDRLESIGNAAKFRPAQDSDENIEARRELNLENPTLLPEQNDGDDESIRENTGKTTLQSSNEAAGANPPKSSGETKDLLLKIAKKVEEIRRRKRNIVQLHGGQIQSALLDQNIGITGSRLQFDARYKNGRVEILAKVFSLPSSSIDSFCTEFSFLRELVRPEIFVLHLLLYFRRSIAADARKKSISRIRMALSKYDSVQAYFYSVTEDNSVKPLEDIP